MASEEELRNITVANGYREIAEKVAKDILQGDRDEYNAKIQQDKQQEARIKLKEQREAEKVSARETNPLYAVFPKYMRQMKR